MNRSDVRIANSQIAGVVNGILPTPTEIPAVFSASVSELEAYIKIRTLIVSILVGIVLTVLATVVILGGVKRIASINEKLVPIMSVSGYEERGREALCSIFSEPFDEYIPHSSGTHIFVKKTAP